MRQSAYTMLFLLITGVYSQSDSIYTTIDADTVTIWHTGSTRNCCSIFNMDVTVNDSIITVTEIASGDLCWCECIFDLSVSITGLDPGNYTVEVFGTDTIYQTYWGSTSFSIDSIAVLGTITSECLNARDDTTFLNVNVLGDTLNLYWNTPMLNCCLEPLWDGWLDGDTFHVTMTDTGLPCDCNCPFELDVSFGPFAAGNYYLDFWNGDYGYPQFTVGNVYRDEIVIVNQNQSDCYSLGIGDNPYPEDFILLKAYPNPFNPAVTIPFILSRDEFVILTIYDILGREITTLVQTTKAAGYNTVQWDGTNRASKAVVSGVYLCRMQAGDYSRTQKIILLR